MATILYAWELGGGLGHVLRFRPLAERIVERGHHVVAALRELRHAEFAFSGMSVGYLPAPHVSWKLPRLIEPVRSYADLLHNVGFNASDGLRALTKAWQTLFAAVRPDAIVCDHAPTALLAASLAGIPAALLGTGFCCPPACEKLPELRPWLAGNRQNEIAIESRILANVNEVRAANGKSAWQCLAELYSSAGDTLLTTFAELDHFPQRTEAQYLGVWEPNGGEAFKWPAGRGPRVFMYSYNFPARDWLLEHLRDRGLPTVVYTYDLPRATAEKLTGSTVLLATAPLDIRQAAAECDFAILNAGHNSSAQFLLAGKPLVLLPISLEQGLLMRRLTSQDLGVSASTNRPGEIQAALDSLVADDRCRKAARAFATRYSTFDAAAAQNEIVDRVEHLRAKPRTLESTTNVGRGSAARPKIGFNRLEIQIADACNLTCDSCSHFSNNGHRGILSIEDAESWMQAWNERILPENFCLLGGEPTINPQLTEMVYLARDKWPDSQLRMTTNGFFLDKHPRLAEALFRTGTIVCLTNHDRSPEYRAHFKEIVRLVSQWRSSYPFVVCIEESYLRWTRRYKGFGQNVMPFDDDSPRLSWQNCACRFCRQLFRGKLWKCPTIAYLQLQKENFPSISSAWDAYLAYEPLDPTCSDDDLDAFLRREDEAICRMCPALPQRFDKPSPLIPRNVLLTNAASS